MSRFHRHLKEEVKFGLEEGPKMTQRDLAQLLAKELLENPRARDRVVKAYYRSKAANDNWWAFKHHVHESLLNNMTKTYVSKLPKVELVAEFLRQMIETENIPEPSGKLSGGLSETDEIDDLYDKPLSYDEVFQDHLEEQIQKAIANLFQKNGADFNSRVLIQIENDIGNLARKASQLFKQVKKRG